MQLGVFCYFSIKVGKLYIILGYNQFYHSIPNQKIILKHIFQPFKALLLCPIFIEWNNQLSNV